MEGFILKVGAYQFSVTGNIDENMKKIKNAIELAFSKGIRLLIFPECSLTGYPPLSIESCKSINFNRVEQSFKELQKLSKNNNMFIIIGSITLESEKYYNSAILFSPEDNKITTYHKRALWGWDKENFNEGTDIGIFNIDNLKLGIRICFEVRFPEYFRELYKENTDLNVVIFYDVAKSDDVDRYELIKAHIKTRAVENVSTIISVNNIKPYQTAPTAVFDSSGKVIIELERNIENLLVYDFERKKLNFNEEGRKIISDNLIKC